MGLAQFSASNESVRSKVKILYDFLKNDYQKRKAFQLLELLDTIYWNISKNKERFDFSFTFLAQEIERKLHFAFKIYDMDRDGYISNGELFEVWLYFPQYL